jgi:hypothetical protein
LNYELIIRFLRGFKLVWFPPLANHEGRRWTYAGHRPKKGLSDSEV